jgi:hypothetical protein
MQNQHLELASQSFRGRIVPSFTLHFYRAVHAKHLLHMGIQNRSIWFSRDMRLAQASPRKRRKYLRTTFWNESR